MSFHHVSWVLKDADVSGSARMVLLVLAHHANDHDISYPSIPTLAQETRLGRSTVINAINSMCENGVLTRLGPQPDPRYKRTMMYELTGFQGGPELGRVQNLDRPDEASKGSRSRTQKEVKGNDSLRSSSGLQSARAPANEIPEDFPDRLRPHARVVTKKLRELAKRHPHAKEVKISALANIIMARPYKPLVKAVFDYAAWCEGQTRKHKDVVTGYRNWLDRTDDLADYEALQPDGRPMPGAPSVSGRPLSARERKAAADEAQNARLRESVMRRRGLA